MRYLKRKTLSRYSANDDSLMIYDTMVPGHTQNGSRAVMDLTGALRLPKGTTDQRPNLSTVETANGPNGYIRYNTTTNSVEAYIDGIWEVVRAPGASAISKQTIGPGDLVETKFGPLTTVPASTSYLASPDNIIVLVENVMQISTTNFTIVSNPSGTSSATGYLAGAAYPAGYYISFADPVPVGKYVTVYYGYAN